MKKFLLILFFVFLISILSFSNQEAEAFHGTVIISEDTTIGSLTLAEDDELRINEGATLTITGTITNFGLIVCNNPFSAEDVGGIIINQGTIDAKPGSFNTFQSFCIVNNFGEINLEDGSAMTIRSASFTNEVGGMIISNGFLSVQKVEFLNDLTLHGTINNFGTIILNNGISISDGIINNFGTITNNDSINNSDGSIIDNFGTINNKGNIQNGFFGDGSIFNNKAGGIINNFDIINNPSESTFNNIGTLNNICNGNFANDGVFIGSLDPTIPCTWDGGGDGVNWSDPQNWVGDIKPQSGDSSINILIHQTSKPTLDINFSLKGLFAIESGSELVIDVGKTLTNNGGLINNFGIIDNFRGIISNNFGSTIDNKSGGAIINDGDGINDGGGIINNSGAINNSGEILNTHLGGINNSGDINNFNGGTINFSGGTITNTNLGGINNNFGGTINNFGAITNDGGGIDNSGGINNSSFITNTNFGGINNLGGGEINNFGIINNNGLGTITNFSGGIINNMFIINNNDIGSIINNNSGGTIDNFVGSVINNDEDGEINNFGIINNSGAINNFLGGDINNSGTINNDCIGVIDGTITGNQPIDVCDPDTDGDGIADSIDTLPNTISSDFSDGTTFGTIASGGSFLTITNLTNGVEISSTGSATVDVCGISTLSFGADHSASITCGSVTIEVISGTVGIEFIATDGTTVTTTLSAGGILTFDAETFTIENKGEEVVIVEVDGIVLSIGPGELFHFIDDIAVAGTFIPIDKTALLLAGVQSISMWMIPVVIASVVIGVFVIKRRK